MRCCTHQDRTSAALLMTGLLLAAGLALLSLSRAPGSELQGGKRFEDGVVWPEPKVVTPGDNNEPPSDAIILFNGKNFDAWKNAEKWKIDADASTTAVSHVQTKQAFGDCQLHLEFATPAKVKGSGQGRGNNGIGFMSGQYEIQVLDSFQNQTYFVGQCAAVYNQTPPIVNASRKPGEWQSYDIIFEAPRFTKDGKLQRPAYVTVLHNGVLVQNHTEIKGETAYDRPNIYKAHADKLPLELLYHGDPVRFRNIWIREFKELEGRRK